MVWSVSIETARRLKPDLILLDIMLPGMDGLRFVEFSKRMSTPFDVKAVTMN